MSKTLRELPSIARFVARDRYAGGWHWYTSVPVLGGGDSWVGFDKTPFEWGDDEPAIREWTGTVLSLAGEWYRTIPQLPSKARFVACDKGQKKRWKWFPQRPLRNYTEARWQQDGTPFVWPGSPGGMWDDTLIELPEGFFGPTLEARVTALEEGEDGLIQFAMFELEIQDRADFKDRLLRVLEERALFAHKLERLRGVFDE